MNQPKQSPLFKAVKKGEIAKIRELVAAGEPLNAQDAERMTPVMRAAQGGNIEAFHVLVQAGADLHAVGMLSIDVLEAAAEGGNAEIVKFLLDKGLPVEGHWQPRSDVARRAGHMTPLFQAAINGHAEIVRLLLERGADRNPKVDGRSVLQHTKDMADLHKLNGEAQEQQNCLAVVALLAEAAPRSEKPAYSAAQEIANFAANGKEPAYLEVCQKLQKRCGEGRSWQPLPDHGVAAEGVLAFTLRGCKKQKELLALMHEVQAAGAHLVLSQPWVPGEDASLVLFPTRDKLAVIAATGTEGANYQVQTSDVIDWLRELEKDNPFTLCFCGHDLIGGAFLGPVKEAKKLAERIVEFCPSCLDEGFESPGELAAFLKKSKSFLLRWD